MSRQTTESLLILLWNANGLTHNRNDLEVILNNRLIDIALICETHLTPNQRFFIPNYVIHRSDHLDGRAHGGTAILVRSQIAHHLLPTIQHNYIQSTAISIACTSFSFSLAAVYCPPRFSISSNQFTEFFNSLGSRFIAGGDFNAKHQHWGSRINNPKGRNLLASMLTNGYSFLSPPGYTYWPTSQTKQPDLLDFFVQSNVHIHENIEFVDELASDHSSILLTISTSPILKIRKPTLTPSMMDWDKFKRSIDENINLRTRLHTEEDIENGVEHLVTTIQNSAWSSSPTDYTHVIENRPRYPNYIRCLIRMKRRARKTWQLTRSPNNRIIYNRLNNELKRLIREFKTHLHENSIAALNASNRSLWNKTKVILKRHEPSPPLRDQTGSWIVTDTDKAFHFANHLSNVFKPHPDIFNANHIQEVTDTLVTPLPPSPPVRHITPAEVREEIIHLARRKSPGYDLITAEVLQQLPRKGLVFLTYLFNSIIRIGYFPIQWKFSVIKMIHKLEKPPDRADSYRPISLLPVCSKLMEKLILRRIMPYVKEVIPSTQFGFQQNHSTVHQLHRITDFLASSLERKHYASGVFFDVSQAFDRVWLDGLLYKLRFLPSSYYIILESFLKDRFYSVLQGSEISDPFPIIAGVPQGSVLAPILYNIYTSDIPSSPETILATFADDTAILSSDPSHINVSFNLQHHLNRLETWFTDWRIKINLQKTTHVTFTLRRQTCPFVFLYGSPLSQSDKVRYLGLHIDRRLTWNGHVNTKRKALDMRRKQLYTLLSHHSRLPLHLKILVYK
jgi:hypothetical protein